MKNMYYITQNGYLYINNGNLYFDSNGSIGSNNDKFSHHQDNSIQFIDTTRAIPIENTASICSFANVLFESNTLNYLSNHNIPLVLFNNYTPIGVFYNNFSQVDGEITILQSFNYISKSKRIDIARKFVLGAIYNKLLNLTYYANRSDKSLFQIQKFQPIIQAIKHSNDINNIMLLEAQVQKLYFSHFKLILKNPNFNFVKREYNPATDPINALLSFSYALLYSTMFTEIASTFLNPFISYLHQPGANRHSLIWDMSEIFKPIICDRLVFKLINTKSIKIEMFDFQDGACLINKQGRKKIVTAFDNKIKTTIFNRETQKQQSYRYIIRNEFYKFIKFLKNETEYSPIKLWW